jgi:hypothetical protein
VSFIFLCSSKFNDFTRSWWCRFFSIIPL